MSGNDYDNNDFPGAVEDIEDSSVAAPSTEDERANLGGILQEEQSHMINDAKSGVNGTSFGGYHKIREAVASENLSQVPNRPAKHDLGSPEGSISTPDDTPSIQGSVLSSLAGSSTPVSYSSLSRPHHSASLQPFDRRFSSRLSPSPLQSPKGLRPGHLTPSSRVSSLSSQLLNQDDEADTPQAPWEVVRWTKLKKISGQVFSEVGKRNFGRATCMSIAASIVVGTSKGFILVFDYHQTLKSIIGPGTKAVECGAITSLAISADHSTVAGGHATGHIFTWELTRPAKPFLHIDPIDIGTLDDRRSDGHVSDSSILHIGFLGTRRTALVSADSRGMGFSHLATRGFGAVGRTVKTTRILGRYPVTAKSVERPRKPSSVLAFAPLPLGNVEQPTDELGLTALLTPYLLVIVSTTPVAQTQHKTSRPKEIAPHSTLSGCLAWFPAVKLKNNSSGESQQAISKTKLVYCWSNILTILDVEILEAEKDSPPQLNYRARSRWRNDEAIVAVQWLSRSVLGVLTISQRLFILEDNSLRVTDSFDLMHKHIYHQDLFSQQLQPVVEQLDESDVSMHGVTADAFHMSFKAYKGRLFLLGFNDITIGTLSNWADRLLALMEDGDFIGAIELATSYYNGDADKLTVGLPDDDTTRHALVQGKLLEMISASLKYAFSQAEKSDEDREDSEVSKLTELAAVTFTACIGMNEYDFLFEDVFDVYENRSKDIFFETLEPYILDGTITAVPPGVLKELIACFASKNYTDRIEEIICQLNTDTMDIDQVTTLCRQYLLYDALIYVWTRSLNDFVTPLIDLLSIVKILNYNAVDDDAVQSRYVGSASKIFPYLAFSLTGRIYPSGASMPEIEASRAKAALYAFLFSGKGIEWPPGSGNTFLSRIDKEPEPPFPYLQMILTFDTPSFLSMLNEAFEDNYLNGDQALSTNGDPSLISGRHQTSTLTPTRQYVTNILIRVLSLETYDVEDVTYLYIFIARNLPKFPQYIILPGTTLHKVLEGLCAYPGDEVKDDCQLSIEYLLSIYHPTDIETLIELFQKAGFYRVLKSVYKSSKQFSQLVETYLDDHEDQNGIFDCIEDCLRPSAGLSKKQVDDVHNVIVTRAKDIAAIDAFRLAQLLELYAPKLLSEVLSALSENEEEQYNFLRALFEPYKDQSTDSQRLIKDPGGFLERYVQLMCKYNQGHVADFISMLQSGDLQLDSVLPALERSGIIDAAIVLMARDGLVRAAMDRLVKHLNTLEIALTSLITAAVESPDALNTVEAVDDLLEAIEKYCTVGVWLCQAQDYSVDAEPLEKNVELRGLEEDLRPSELLWLDLIDTIVILTKSVTTATLNLDNNQITRTLIDASKITTALRTAIHHAFSALLASTTAHDTRPSLKDQPKTSTSRQPHTTFLRILQAFLGRASRSAPSLSDLRGVLSEIFSAYTFEETILSLANRFLDKDAFAQVSQAHTIRQRGWRPRGQICEVCRKRAWGPGAGGDIWDAWERKERLDEERRARTRVQRGGGEEARRLERGKGRANGATPVSSRSSESDGEEEDAQKSSEEELGPLVVFACRHLFHKKCLLNPSNSDDRLPDSTRGNRATLFTCPLCTSS